MAIYRFSASVVSRGSGQSAIAKAAYNAREPLRDERTAQLKDYSRLGGVLFSGIFAPRDAPAWTRDRAQLWNAVERREDASTRPNQAQLARNIELALPHELTDQQRQQLVTDFVREQFSRKGMIADVAIHAPGGKGDDRNYHAHILVTMREIEPDGFGKKVRDWNSRKQLEQWREQWEKIQNRYLERYGHEARVDRRTLEAQGIDREPTTHRGPALDAMHRKGINTERGAAARETFTRNLEVEKLKRELAEIEKQIAAAEREQQPTRPGETRRGGEERTERNGRDTESTRATPEPPENPQRTVAAIWAAYNHSDNPQAFAEALAERGMLLAVVTKEEAERSHREAAFASEIGNRAASYREGELVAVTWRGNVYQLNQRTTGDNRAAAQKFLAPLDGKQFPGIEATRQSIASVKEAIRNELYAARLERATTIDARARTANDNRPPALVTAARYSQRAAGKTFAVAEKFFETVFSLLMPDAPATPDQIGRMITQQQREAAAQAKERYISQHERIQERQQEQADRQEQQRDYYRKHRERER